MENQTEKNNYLRLIGEIQDMRDWVIKRLHFLNATDLKHIYDGRRREIETYKQVLARLDEIMERESSPVD